MMRRSFCFAAGCALFALAGCQKPPADMTMKPPPRAPELDHLDAFVGNWESTSEAHMADVAEPTTMKGKGTMWWEADKTALLGRWEMEMGPDSIMRGVEMWRWDPARKKYATFWTDNFGGMGHGWAKYDPATKTFTMKARGTGPMGDTVMEGTTKMLDNNTMEWSFTEWDSWKLKKHVDAKGKSIRK